MAQDLPRIESVDEEGRPFDASVLETTGTAFNPAGQHLDLTKDEKRRTTALMMAIQAYKNLLIPDAAYLREVADMARRNEGPKIRPATIDAMVEAAFKFDCFISSGALLESEPDAEEPESDRGSASEAA